MAPREGTTPWWWYFNPEVRREEGASGAQCVRARARSSGSHNQKPPAPRIFADHHRWESARGLIWGHSQQKEELIHDSKNKKAGRGKDHLCLCLGGRGGCALPLFRVVFGNRTLISSCWWYFPLGSMPERFLGEEKETN